MVATEEMRLNSKSHASIADASSSAPTILLAENNNSSKRGNGGRDSRTSQRSYEPRVCHNFAKGFCRFGATCKFVQDNLSNAK